ncbi:glucose PTS transporter subunit IIA [Enterococcus raffinosus]|uniref:glucose PTS transporter subunit IIA n=1 Tax=Enterococcus raffinosus TaxID=71452 RepID=UPI001C94A9B2|nr:glucose PTS transporter subunit IIA [Enterococcus raffinosus]QZO10952.1 glucose PTS transporter subunit IIA [Enterococcus raffinosus]
MKEAVQKSMRTFARAIIQPVMFMAVSGLIISIAAIMRMEFMPDVVANVGNFFFGIINSGAIGSLSVIFCVGIAAALTKKKTDSAIVAITCFMIFLYANNTWLTLTDRLAEPGEQGLFGTGQNMVMGIQVNDMGVFLGIVIGCLVGFIVNRFGNVKFHKYLTPYEGTKFAYAISIFTTIALAIIVTYVWPVINSGVNAAVSIMASSGPFGFFAYGFLNRMLLPVGMHHLLWMPLHFTPMGGTAQIAGETVSGAFNIWLAQLGDISNVTQMNPAIGFLTNFGSSAFPIAIAAAFIKTALPENKAKVKAIVIPAVILAALAGTTEPIEFLFLFAAPVLWLAHAILFGFSFFLSSILGLRVMVGSIPETIPSLFVPMNLGRAWLIVPIILIIAVLEYFAFKYLIVKLNLPTLGREPQEAASIQNEETSIKGDEAGLAVIVKGLGGVENISEIYNCYSRLRLDVLDDKKVDIDLLKTFPSSGVVDKQKHIQIIIGIGVTELREALESYVERLRNGQATMPLTKTKTGQVVYAPASGEIIPIEEVPDEVFSSKSLGNGFAIMNHDGMVYSPTTGKITTIFPTLHAIGIENENGEQILVHMGIDTVDLAGKPFNVKVKEGQVVKQGDLLAQIDNAQIKDAGKNDMIIVVTLENSSGRVIAPSDKILYSDVAFEV